SVADVILVLAAAGLELGALVAAVHSAPSQAPGIGGAVVHSRLQHVEVNVLDLQLAAQLSHGGSSLVQRSAGGMILGAAAANVDVDNQLVALGIHQLAVLLGVTGRLKVLQSLVGIVAVVLGSIL